MEHLINPRVTNIQISGIRRFYNLVADKEDMISLTIGQPDFPTPLHVKEAGIEAIRSDKTTYTPNAGLMPLRQAISEFYTKYAPLYRPAEEIIVTVGASQAIDITLRTILQPEDEVILPGPVYPGYEPLISLAGGKPVLADTTGNGFKLTVSILKQYITPKTKCVILPYPSNPTGVTLTYDDLEEIADFLADKDIFILSDEIYSELTYDDTHVSIASFPQVRDKTIIINGLSKSHSMTGWRIGFTLAPAWLSTHMLKVHQYNATCATSVSQYAAIEALSNGLEDPVNMREAYRARRDYCLERLENMGLTVEKPNGAFYIFPKFPIKEMTSLELGLALVEKAGLAIVPGDAFSHLGEGYMRLSYAYSMELLQEGMDRLERFLSSNKLL
ncbi:aminotransferase A [Terribacillus saccharophilus]|uniref:Aminotransferase n=1 Tax=Terribacillus saccharophilus TaxID=361277 RepID=A0A268A9Y5_9BACI|nr:aminotransferase A [Terribacillus saccharophilus]PAD20935.1 aromatic amino acid aminotransferase [Terribacillus saccharophilus]